MMDEPVPPRIRRWNAIYWLATLWLMGWLGIMLWQTLSWTDAKRGFYNGAVLGGIISPLLLIVTVPLGAAGRAIAKIRPLRRYQLAASLIVPGADGATVCSGDVACDAQAEAEIAVPDAARLAVGQAEAGGLVGH